MKNRTRKDSFFATGKITEKAEIKEENIKNI